MTGPDIFPWSPVKGKGMEKANEVRVCGGGRAAWRKGMVQLGPVAMLPWEGGRRLREPAVILLPPPSPAPPDVMSYWRESTREAVEWFGQSEAPWVLSALDPAGHGWGSGLGPLFALDWVATRCGPTKVVGAVGGRGVPKREWKNLKEGR